MTRKLASIVCIIGIVTGFLWIQLVFYSLPITPNVDPDYMRVGDEGIAISLGQFLFWFSIMSLILVQVFMKRK